MPPPPQSIPVPKSNPIKKIKIKNQPQQPLSPQATTTTTINDHQNHREGDPNETERQIDNHCCQIHYRCQTQPPPKPPQTTTTPLQPPKKKTHQPHVPHHHHLQYTKTHKIDRTALKKSTPIYKNPQNRSTPTQPRSTNRPKPCSAHGPTSRSATADLRERGERERESKVIEREREGTFGKKRERDEIENEERACNFFNLYGDRVRIKCYFRFYIYCYSRFYI